MLGVALPAPLAQADTPEQDFDLVPLFFRGGSMSSAPFEGGTHSRASTTSATNFTALGPVHPADLVLAKAAAFRVVLPQRTSTPGVVTTDVRVDAVGLLGERITLAQRTVVTSRGELREEERNTSELGASTAPVYPQWGSLEAFVRDEERRAGDALSGELDGGGLAYEAACLAPGLPLCDTMRGDPGLGLLRPCRPPPPQNQNLPMFLVGTAGAAADAAARNATGRGLCQPLSHDVNATGDILPRPNASVGPLPLPTFPEELRSPVGVTYPSRSLMMENDSWSIITLDLDAPTALAQDDASATLPAGYRLALTLTTHVRGEQGSGAASFAYGHPSAPAHLALRTATPGAFGLLTGGRAIGEGVAFGRTSASDGLRDYRLEIPAGRAVEVRLEQGPGSLRAWEADGSPRNNSGARFFFSEGPARSALVRFLRETTSADDDHALRVTFLDPPAPVPVLADGETAHGALGPAASSYSAYFFAWQAQRYTLTLTQPANASFHLKVGDARAWDVVTSEDGEVRTFSARASGNGTYRVEVLRDHGSGPFTLALALDAGGDHTQAPPVEMMWALAEDERIRALQGAGAGVDLVVASYASAHLWHQDGANRQGIGALPHSYAPFARGADGRFAVSANDTVWDAFGQAPARIAPSALTLAFGPDALYYTEVGHNFEGRLVGRLVRITSDLVEQAMEISNPGLIAVAPDGQVYITTSNEVTTVIAPDMSAHAPAPARLQGVRAFDGTGAAYRVFNGSLVERVAQDGSARIVAVAPFGRDIMAIAVSEGHLWLGLQTRAPPSAGLPSGLARVPLVDAGFGGFQPDFAPGTPANLRIVHAEDVVLRLNVTGAGVREEHLVRVTVQNDGAAPARSFSVDVGTQCPSPCWGQMRVVENLAAGETRVVEVPWHTGMGAPHAGDHRIDVRLDAQRRVVESNEDDNAAAVNTTSFIGGNFALCRAVIDVTGVPSPVVGGRQACDDGR